MTLVVDIRHWLTDRGEIPEDNPRLRANALRIARFIEYGADLKPLEARETLIDCHRRPQRRPCMGLLWVLKLPNDTIQAYCLDCRTIEAVVSGWQDTMWSDGIMPPCPTTDD